MTTILILLMLLLLGGTIAFAASRGKTESPAAELAKRLADGEISQQEYNRQTAALPQGRPVLLPPEADEQH